MMKAHPASKMSLTKCDGGKWKMSNFELV